MRLRHRSAAHLALDVERHPGCALASRECEVEETLRDPPAGLAEALTDEGRLPVGRHGESSLQALSRALYEALGRDIESYGSLFDLLRGFGIKEMNRTGRVAMTRGGGAAGSSAVKVPAGRPARKRGRS